MSIKRAYFCDECSKIFPRTGLRKVKTRHGDGDGGRYRVTHYLCYQCFREFINEKYSSISFGREEAYKKLTSLWGRIFGTWQE